MTDARQESVPRFRLAVLLWLVSMIGAVSVTVMVLPQFSKEVTLPAPTWLIMLAGTLQSGLLLALATWTGIALAPKVGFRAPLFEAVAARRPILPKLRSPLVLGALAGVPGGLALLWMTRSSPAEIAGLAGRYEPPLPARMLYGGFTEEVLLRWCVMTFMTWLLWRFVQRSGHAVRSTFVIVAIVASSLLFALGHLPAARFLLGGLTPSTVIWVLGVNTSLGLLFGWLYWRHGLESAMVAHAVTHLINYLASSLLRA